MSASTHRFYATRFRPVQQALGRGKTVGKGNNSQRNDKKNKKVKKGGKAQDSKSTGKKR
jgi:hypothetical protein